MREIIFRGKDPESGEWYYGYYVKRNDGDRGYLILEDYYLESYEIVKPETICQYTGLTDKNGTKIFEGDIVHMNSKKFGLSGHGLVVFWNGGFAIDDRKRKRLYPFMQNGQYNAGDYRVDCNIYDNPELMEVRNG